MIRSTGAATLVACALISLACGSSDEPEVELPRRSLPAPTTGPYVSVAVDNHFHDIHTEDDIEIAADRPFVVKNQGSNLHNVTIPGTDINVDLEPGEEFELDPVGEGLEPGTWQVVCRFHADQGMFGAITVTDPT